MIEQDTENQIYIVFVFYTYFHLSPSVLLYQIKNYLLSDKYFYELLTSLTNCCKRRGMSVESIEL